VKDGSFDDPVKASLKKLSGHFNNGNIIVIGKFKSDTPVSAVIVYNDPKGGSSYNSVAWTTPVIGADSFRVQMPISELPKHDGKSYSPYLRLVFKNDIVKEFAVSNYAFVNGKPDIDFQYGARSIYPKNDWKVIDFSSQEVNHDDLAKYVLDGDYSTFWHSRWSGATPIPDFPHSLTIDMRQKWVVHGFEFVQRQDGRRNIKELTIKVSNDDKNWQSLGDFQLAHTTLPQSIKLKHKRSFRYFKLITHSAWDDSQFSTLAEVAAF
jgi:hypothetical protein